MNDMYLKNGISAYNKAAAKMPQASNVVILYDGVLRHLSDARNAFEKNRHGDMMRSISKANGILLGLQKVLRADISQPLFDKLDSFYGSSIIRISQQPQKKFEDNQFRSLLSAVRVVRDAWAEVAGKSPRSGHKNATSSLSPQSPNVHVMGQDMTFLAATLHQGIGAQGRPTPIAKAQEQVKQAPTSQEKTNMSALADMDDVDLMDRVVASDQLAYREIVTRYFEKMYALAYRMVQQGADAEDIAQDVFFKLWTNRENWQREGAQISTWLYRVTLNRSIDFKRRPVGEDLDNAPEVEDRAPSAVTLIQRSQTSQMLKQATLQLSEQQQAALALFYQQELSNAEAAQVLGIKVNAMESLLKRARQKLREILKHSSNEMLETVRE